MKGAMDAYEELRTDKNFLWAVNNIQYLKGNEVTFEKWRTVVLRSTRLIANAKKKYEGE